MPRDYQARYRAMLDGFRIANDAEFGIVTRRTQDNVWLRDATKAYALGDARRNHDSLIVERNNMLMRALSRLRGIDYALSQDKALSDIDREELRLQLQEVFKLLQKEVMASDINAEQLLKKEKTFNTELVRVLYEANLTEGCLNRSDAEKLLGHYRILASLLDPAMALVTLTYDAHTKMLNRETQYPVTEKTVIQKAEIERLREVVPNPKENELTGHTRANLATQKADALFVGLMLEDDRMLPAQARKTHLVGAKNAFVVKSEVAFDVTQVDDAEHLIIDDPKPFWLVRTGVPVFVGSGESHARNQQHTRENLEQIRHAAQRHMGGDAKPIHITTLNTNVSQDKQDVMIREIKAATADNKDNQDVMSKVPVNALGTLPIFSVSLANAVQNGVFERQQKHKFLWSPGQAANRVGTAVYAVLEAEYQNMLSVVHCASGQDRTGTVVEKAMQRSLLEKWWSHYIMSHGGSFPSETDIENQLSLIEGMRARGFNAAEITSHMVPGSPGIKPESTANNLFDSTRTYSEAAQKEWYLGSADTNKKNKVEQVKFLKQPPEQALVAYEEAIGALHEAAKPKLHDGPLLRELRNSATQLLAEFQKPEAGAGRAASSDSFKRVKHAYHKVKRKVRSVVGLVDENSRDLAHLTMTLQYTSEVIHALDATEADVQKAEHALARLEAMREVLPGHERMRLKIASFVLIATIVIAVVLVATLPPVGAFFMVGAGAFALAMKIGVGSLGATAASRGIFAGFSLWKEGVEHGKSEKVTEFKAAYEAGKAAEEKLGGKPSQPSDGDIPTGSSPKASSGH